MSEQITKPKSLRNVKTGIIVAVILISVIEVYSLLVVTSAYSLKLEVTSLSYDIFVEREVYSYCAYITFALTNTASLDLYLTEAQATLYINDYCIGKGSIPNTLIKAGQILRFSGYFTTLDKTTVLALETIALRGRGGEWTIQLIITGRTICLGHSTPITLKYKGSWPVLYIQLH
jgi:hypothetical protein